MQTVPALYDESGWTPAYGDMCGPRDATFKLKNNTGGFRVIGITNSTDKLVLVRPDPFLAFRGKANADIATHVSGTGSIYYSDASDTFTDTTVDTPTDSLFNGTDQTVSSGAWIEAVYRPYMNAGVLTERWVIIGADCP